MSSRLFHEIREKRSLAYEIGTTLKSYSDTGSFLIHAGVDSRKLKDAVSIMVRQLRRTKRQAVSKRELEMAKECFKGGLLMAMESTMSRMLFLGEQLLIGGKIFTKDEIITRVDKVDAGALRYVANKLFKPDQLRLAVIGPHSEEERLKAEKILDI